MRKTLAPLALAAMVLWPAIVQAQSDPLPSWNEGPTKRSILDFVARVTKEGSPDFVPVSERIATFDNDGTMWVEQPMYTQIVFAVDRVKALAPQHADWKAQPLLAKLTGGDLKALAEAGEKGLLEVLATTHAGMTVEEFERTVTDWLATAKHPRFQRRYTECIYQPMVEVMAYLRANGFKTYIVSGGGTDFMRPFTEKAYGVPKEQVIGSSGKVKYELRDGKPVLLKIAEINFIDDKSGKPIGINEFIGKRPIMAFGNSDGDYEMLRWATSGPRPGFGLIVHHTDAEREYAYDRNTLVGRLVKALEEAPKYGWSVADMKRDWKVIFPPLN